MITSKTITSQLLPLLIFGASAAIASAATITTSVSPVGPVTIGSTLTVSFDISAYTDPDEIDGYEFKVTYPAALFSLVGFSGSMHDGSGFGASENWLRKPPQDGVGAGSILTDGTTTSLGTVNVSVGDARGPSTRGTTALTGFLYSFDLMATSAGIGSITPSVPASGAVLYDVSFSPAGATPIFVGAPATVVPEPALCGLMAMGVAALLTGRLRRR